MCGEPRERRPGVLLLALALTGLSLHWSAPSDPAGAVPLAIAPEDAAWVRDVERWFERRSSGLTHREISAVARVLVADSRAHGLDPGLVLAVIEVESDGHAFAVSDVGALGLMQLRPFVARAQARELGLAWHGPNTLLEPVANVRLGIAYLHGLLERFGSVERALVAYNWGPTRIAARVSRGQALPSEYARRVRNAFGAPLPRGARVM